MYERMHSCQWSLRHNQSPPSLVNYSLTDRHTKYHIKLLLLGNPLAGATRPAGTKILLGNRANIGRVLSLRSHRSVPLIATTCCPLICISTGQGVAPTPPDGHRGGTPCGHPHQSRQHFLKAELGRQERPLKAIPYPPGGALRRRSEPCSIH